jgi:hypothetical protein
MKQMDGNLDQATQDSVVEETLDGTEYEDIGITKPFNPTLINIQTKQMSLDTLIKRIKEKRLIYHRISNVQKFGTQPLNRV